MSNPYRNALAELVRRWYAASGDQDLLDVADAMDHARTLLAQPEPAELTEQELWQIWDDIDSTIPDILRAAIAADRARYGRPTSQPLPFGYIDPEHKGEGLVLLETFYRACNAEGGTADEIHLRGIRAVLATHSTPQPPADGEVGYALLELRSLVMGLGYAGMHVDAQRLERAADLLQRQHPQPVAVSERLPGAKDCALWPGDPEATPWCWAGKDIDGGWEWAQISMLGLGTDTLSRIIAGGGWTHWLPANALPTPTPEATNV
jgi:hypothetical protein